MMTTPSPQAVAAVEAGMLDRCEISAPGTEEYDPETNELEPTPGALGYVGCCSLAAAGTTTGAGTASRGDQAEVERAYYVSIPRDATPHPASGHIVRIVDVHCDGDDQVVGKTLLVRRVRYGTRMARRILLCDLIEAIAT